MGSRRAARRARLVNGASDQDAPNEGGSREARNDPDTRLWEVRGLGSWGRLGPKSLEPSQYPPSALGNEKARLTVKARAKRIGIIPDTWL